MGIPFQSFLLILFIMRDADEKVNQNLEMQRRDIGAQNYTHCDSLGEKKLAFQNASNIPVGIVRI